MLVLLTVLIWFHRFDVVSVWSGRETLPSDGLTMVFAGESL